MPENFDFDSSRQFLFLDEWWQLIGRWRHLRDAFAPANRKQLFVLSAHEMNNQVNNGGFQQYYFNTDGEYADAAIEGLNEMGLPEWAELIAASSALAPTIGDTYIYSPEWEPYDDAYYELNEDTFLDRIERYVILHEKEIFTFPDEVKMKTIIGDQ